MERRGCFAHETLLLSNLQTLLWMGKLSVQLCGLYLTMLLQNAYLLMETNRFVHATTNHELLRLEGGLLMVPLLQMHEQGRQT